MRNFWFSIIILFILIVSGLYMNYSFKERTQEAMKTIEIMESNLQQGDWEGVAAHLKDLQYEWKSMERPWKMFIEHEEMDKIQIRILELEDYILYEDEALTKINLSVLKYLIRHIYTKNRLTLGNVF